MVALSEGDTDERFQTHFSGRLQLTSEAPPDNQDVVISIASVSGDDCTLEEYSRTGRNDKGSIPPIQPTAFSSNACVIVEAGIEVFLWCGQNIDNQTKQKVQSFMQVREDPLLECWS